MESREFNFKSLVELLISRWKLFVLVALIGALVGVVISLPVIMPPRFKSTAVVYPVNVLTYSDESETEQLLQVFESSSVRDSIIEKFDLYSHYGIERGAPASRYYLLEEYNDRFIVSKTLYESVRLEVYDEDPGLAFAMAQEMLRLVNAKFNHLANERGRNLAGSFKSQMDYQTSVMDSVNAMIRAISTGKGILDYEAQTRELVRGYFESGRGSNAALKKRAEEWLVDLQEEGNAMVALQNVLRLSAERRSEVERNYLFWREYEYRDINYLDEIVSPEISDKKAWPVRWLIVVLSTGSALLLAMVIVALNKSR